MKKYLLKILMATAAIFSPWLMGLDSIQAQQTGKWGDQGDGTFRNPVLAADYSDPDVVRVGEDYYMVASTFETSPGVTILHSKDLVNWETIGAVFNDLTSAGPEFNWDRMNRYGKGIFAPSIRYHDGKFYVFVNCHSGEGFFSGSAINPAGPWTITQLRDRNGKPLRTRGWTDPCPFWDDDGNAYLASSRPGKAWYGYLFKMSADGTQLLDSDVDKMNDGEGPFSYPGGGTLYSPFQSTEGNKIYKRNGYYYLLHIEFLDKGQGKGTYVMRSKNIYGTKTDGTPGGPGDPGTYDSLKFAADTGRGQNLPGQGALIDTPDGRWFYMAQFNRYGSDGRTPCLVPVTWIDDWPVVGVKIKDQQGEMVWQMKKPIEGGRIQFPQGSDEFNGSELGKHWQWNHQPRADKWSLGERSGFLRLYAFKPAGRGGFFMAGNVLNQHHFRSEKTIVTVKLDCSQMADGQEAGLVHFNGGKNFASLGIVQKSGVRSFKYEEDGQIGGVENLPAATQYVWLRSMVGFDDLNSYSYSLDGDSFKPMGGAYKLRTANYRGDMVGLYTFNQDKEAGFVDVDFFHYEFKNK